MLLLAATMFLFDGLQITYQYLYVFFGQLFLGVNIISDINSYLFRQVNRPQWYAKKIVFDKNWTTLEQTDK